MHLLKHCYIIFASLLHLIFIILLINIVSYIDWLLVVTSIFGEYSIFNFLVLDWIFICNWLCIAGSRYKRLGFLENGLLEMMLVELPWHGTLTDRNIFNKWFKLDSLTKNIKEHVRINDSEKKIYDYSCGENLLEW